jgi:hypothetical protein
VKPPPGGADSFEPLSEQRAAAAAVWLHEMYCGVAALSELCVRLCALLSCERATGTPASYAAAGTLAKETMVEAYTHAGGAMRARAGWMRQSLSDAPGEEAEGRRLLFRVPDAATTESAEEPTL